MEEQRKHQLFKIIGWPNSRYSCLGIFSRLMIATKELYAVAKAVLWGYSFEWASVINLNCIYNVMFFHSPSHWNHVKKGQARAAAVTVLRTVSDSLNGDDFVNQSISFTNFCFLKLSTKHVRFTIIIFNKETMIRVLALNLHYIFNIFESYLSEYKFRRHFLGSH